MVYRKIISANQPKDKYKMCDAKCRTQPADTCIDQEIYEGWNFNSGNYLFTTDTK